METINDPANKPPDNNLVWAILCTVLCCLPLGIVAIIKSTKVNDRLESGLIRQVLKKPRTMPRNFRYGVLELQ